MKWLTPGGGVSQGGLEGPFLYILAMLPLMRIHIWEGRHTRHWREHSWMMQCQWPRTKMPSGWCRT